MGFDNLKNSGDMAMTNSEKKKAGIFDGDKGSSVRSVSYDDSYDKPPY